MAFGKKRIPKHLIVYDYHHYSAAPKRPLSWGWICVSVLIFFSSMLFAAITRASEAENAGALVFNHSGGKQSALHLETKVRAEINGLVAQVTYEQHFKNQSDDWRTGTYTFPLSDTAGINHMEMTIGERTIVGEIKEKQEAKRIYQKAQQQGQRAALTEQQRPNLFTQKIANIPPGETVSVTIVYQQKIDYKDKSFEWRLPTTMTPRYIPGNTSTSHHDTVIDTDDEQAINNANTAQTYLEQNNDTNTFGWAQPTQAVGDAHLITPPMQTAYSTHTNPISIHISLNSGLSLSNISSLYHNVNISKDNDTHTINLQNGQADMNRDFVLHWSPIASSRPSAAVFSEEIDNTFYSLLMLIPPTEETKAKLARDIIFIIDTSGSMKGSSIQQAKQSLNLAVQELTNKDRFNIIEFNSHHSLLFNDARPATQLNIQRALTWVDRLSANGGTEMHPALEAAFRQMPEDERLQQIVFITDGAVGNEKALFRLIHNELKASRLFTIGIGSAPNSYFMRKAAEFGRGSFSHIGHQQDIAETMSEIFNKLNSAVSTNIVLDWQNDVEQYPEKIGELYQNEALVVTAKSDTAPSTVTVSGQLNDRAWQQHINTDGQSNHKGIGSLWAREKIEHIEDLNISGAINEETTKENILSVALRHKLISRFTSFIAVEKQRARPTGRALQHSAVANQMAKGQKANSIMLPQTATTGEISWWLGLFSFVMWVITSRMRGD